MPFSRPSRLVTPSFMAALGATLALAAGVAQAGPSDQSTGLYLQGGHNILHGTDTDNVFIGVMVPFGGTRMVGPTQMSSYLDAYYGQWRGPLPSGVDKTYNQVGALAIARFRFDQGQSPLFTEAGLGVSYLDDVYMKPGRTQASRANFSIRFGVGYSFGEAQRHEVSLNYQHFSNAGLKKPNPGEDFAQVRYAYRF